MKRFGLALGLAALMQFGQLMISADASAKIIQPNPIDFSDIQSFHQEWCAPNQASDSQVSQVCFGETSFRNERTVRAVLLVVDANPNQHLNRAPAQKPQKFLYVESEWPGVDLLALDVEIVGPVHDFNSPKIPFSEIGELQMSIDSKGEVDAVQGSTPHLGHLLAVRP